MVTNRREEFCGVWGRRPHGVYMSYMSTADKPTTQKNRASRPAATELYEP